MKLDDISISWAARSLRTGDPHIRTTLEEDTTWYDCRAPPLVLKRSSPIAEAFHKCSFDPYERSYGNRDDISPAALIDLTLLEPHDERGKHQAYWAVGLNNLLDED